MAAQLSILYAYTTNFSTNKIIIIILLLIARKLTLEYDQMRVTSRIPKNYKKSFKKNYIHHIKTKIRHIKNYLHRTPRVKHSSPIGLSISSLDMKLVKRIVINTIKTSVCESTCTTKKKQPKGIANYEVEEVQKKRP